MPWEPEATVDTRRSIENLNATSDTWRARTCVFLHSLSLIYSMWGKKSVRYFHSETVLFCRMFVLLLERDGSVIRSHGDLISNIPWLACTIYSYANVLYTFVFVFFCDTSKASENLTFILNKVLFCRVFGWMEIHTKTRIVFFCDS